MGCCPGIENQQKLHQVRRLKVNLNQNDQCSLQYIDEVEPEIIQKFLDDNEQLFSNLQIITQISQVKNNKKAKSILLQFNKQLGLLIIEQKFYQDNIENSFEQFQIQLMLFYNMAFLEQQLRLNNFYEFRYIQKVNWNSEMINKFNTIIEKYSHFFQDINQQEWQLQNVQKIIQNLETQISQWLDDKIMEKFFNILNEFSQKLYEANLNLQNRTNINDHQQMPIESSFPLNGQQFQQIQMIEVPLYFCEKQNAISKKCKHTCQKFAFLNDNGHIVCHNKGCQIFNLQQCCFIQMDSHYQVVDESQSYIYNGKNKLKMCNKMIVDTSLNRGFQNMDIPDQEKQNFIHRIRQLQFYRDLPN